MQELVRRLTPEVESLLRTDQAPEQEAWRVQIESLLGTAIAPRPDVDWRSMYSVLSSVDLSEPLAHESVLRSSAAVEVLLEAGYDPAQNNSVALRLAVRAGYLSTVRLLLAQGRADPTVAGNDPIKAAAERGHARIVAALLQSPDVDPNTDNNYALEVAVAGNHTDVVAHLLADRRVLVPESRLRAMIDVAIENSEIASLLSKRARSE